MLPSSSSAIKLYMQATNRGRAQIATRINMTPRLLSGLGCVYDTCEPAGLGTQHDVHVYLQLTTRTAVDFAVS